MSERRDFTPEWGDFVDEFIRALSDDDAVNVAINTFEQFKDRPDRERWSLALWLAALYACGNAYQSLGKKVPPLTGTAE